MKESLSVKGLTNEVTVYRDERGMPHIYAENEHDLYFAVRLCNGPGKTMADGSYQACHNRTTI